MEHFACCALWMEHVFMKANTAFSLVSQYIDEVWANHVSGKVILKWTLNK